MLNCWEDSLDKLIKLGVKTDSWVSLVISEVSGKGTSAAVGTIVVEMPNKAVRINIYFKTR